ncbi:hypothetical protein ACWDX6_24090 [Streptomyces sp. NPDC003027]
MAKPKGPALADVVDALKEHGWRQTARGVFAPAVDVIRRTPGNIPAAWWAAPTYSDYRILKISATSAARASYWTSLGPPWAGAREAKVSAAEAIEFIEETARLAAENEETEA